ncbi:MAG: serine/threonine protein kinase [Myxococcales bacterium]|nr:serine/threonine protein kinase [Myxococcales bacterium]
MTRGPDRETGEHPAGSLALMPGSSADGFGAQEGEPDGTPPAERPTSVDSPRERTLASPSLTEGPGRVVVGPTIGEGGMAKVRLGFQANLSRSVAVKVLKSPDRAGEERLLREAKLTARLQHPNIVPVHDVLRSADGELRVVLKRVEGTRWSALLRAPSAVLGRLGARDQLDWNLSVLEAVCRAVSYAHEQGVIHRDLKPSNVMIGTFGEVYVLDWGIGGLWGDHQDPEIAHVRESPIAGTARYMAPEQLEGLPEALGPRTDVYLLGAILYEIVSGEPPHSEREGGAPRERPVAPLAPTVPREMAALALRALSPDPDDRPVSVEELRLEVARYRRRREALELLDASDRKLALAQSTEDATQRDLLLTQSEAGFRFVLEAWPEDERAAQGVRSIAIERIERALRQGHAAIALEWLERLEDPPASTSRRVRDAYDAAERGRAEAMLEQRNRDPAVGVLMRRTLLAIFAPIWFVAWIWFAARPPETVLPVVVFLVVYTILGFAFVGVQGFAIVRTQSNRTNLVGALFSVGSSTAWAMACHARGFDLAAAYGGFLLLQALTLGLVTWLLDLRAMIPWVISTAGFIVAAAIPAVSGWAMALSAVALAASTVIQNRILIAKTRRAASAARRERLEGVTDPTNQ